MHKVNNECEQKHSKMKVKKIKNKDQMEKNKGWCIWMTKTEKEKRSEMRGFSLKRKLGKENDNGVSV